METRTLIARLVSRLTAILRGGKLTGRLEGITLDRQVATKACPGCGVDFDVVRGAVYRASTPFGLYMIALHGHSPDGRIAHLAIAVHPGSETASLAQAAAIVVTARPDRFECGLDSWADSPWRGETYLGEMLEPAEVRSGSYRGLFFEIVDRVVADLPEVVDYFAE